MKRNPNPFLPLYWRCPRDRGGNLSDHEHSFSRKDTPKIFGHYIYLMEYDTMEAAAGAAVATGTSGQAAGSVDDTSAAASMPAHCRDRFRL